MPILSKHVHLIIYDPVTYIDYNVKYIIIEVILHAYLTIQLRKFVFHFQYGGKCLTRSDGDQLFFHLKRTERENRANKILYTYAYCAVKLIRLSSLCINSLVYPQWRLKSINTAI